MNPLHIAGNDAFNDAIDKLQTQQIEERQHKENLAIQLEANELSRKMLDEAKETNQKSKNSNIISIVSAGISLLSVIANILIAIYL